MFHFIMNDDVHITCSPTAGYISNLHEGQLNLYVLLIRGTYYQYVLVDIVHEFGADHVKFTCNIYYNQEYACTNPYFTYQ